MKKLWNWLKFESDLQMDRKSEYTRNINEDKKNWCKFKSLKIERFFFLKEPNWLGANLHKMSDILKLPPIINHKESNVEKGFSKYFGRNKVSKDWPKHKQYRYAPSKCNS